MKAPNVNTIIPGLVLIFLVSACASKQATTSEAVTRPPNVLFIAVDDLNDWIGAMGGHPDAKTPNLDRLAAEGVLFTNAHCQAPLCGPSRASVMTGLRPSTTGIYGMIDDDDIEGATEATEDIVFLPGYFKNHGYHTMGIGKLFHEHAPKGLFNESGGRVGGFGPKPDERFVWDGYGPADPDRYGRTSTDWGAYPAHDSLMPDHQSASWAVERLQKQYEQPFFLAVGFLRPHVPWYVPQHWFDLYKDQTLARPPYKADDLNDVPDIAHQINDLPMMPTTEWAKAHNEWDNIIRAYLACVSFVDYEIGRMMDALKKSPHANNTVVVLWSDHGYRLGEKGTFAKQCLWEEATHAPLMFAGPGVPSGKTVDAPVEMLSIYPTLLDICGLPAYERNEGVSLKPLLSGHTIAELAAITTYGKDNHAVRSADYRYIRYEDGSEELYDHSIDPNEWNNIAQGHAEERQRMGRMLPRHNAEWAPASTYNFQPYFKEQKAKGAGK
jgi:arylsulfatase A-like enzyme